MPADQFDFIIVGAGSAGCVVANRLSEDPGNSVLLLEAGPMDSLPQIHQSFVPELFKVWADRTVTQQYYIEKHPDTAGRWRSMYRGATLGGSSAINGMIYVRGNRRDYDRWEELGNLGWSYKTVLPYFKKSENYAHGPDPYHGSDGPLHVRRLIEPTLAAQTFVEAAHEHGFAGPPWDFNGEIQEGGADFYQVNLTEYCTRASTAVAFLHPIRFDRPNLTIKTDTRAIKLLTERGKGSALAIRGVKCLEAGMTADYLCAREVIVCSGAFESPKLLMLSGIGPAVELNRFGIDTLLELPGVGENLHDHLLLLLYYGARKPVGATKFIAEAGLFTRLDPTANSLSLEPKGWPNLQYHFTSGIPFFTPPGVPTQNYIFAPTLAKPRSRGRLRLISPDPRHSMLIDPGYLSEPEDLAVLVHAVELTRALAETRTFKELNGGEQTPGLPAVGEPRAKYEAFVKQWARTVWHPVGSCKMGPEQDRMAVVDSRLRVRGTEKLRVADASIMPEITTGNTNAPAIMIGERAADFVLGRG